MYPNMYPRPTAPPSEYAAATNNNSSYRQAQAGNQNYHTPTEQLMVGFDKFIRRYESRFCTCITIPR
jgi:hypothetical protein